MKKTILISLLFILLTSLVLANPMTITLLNPSRTFNDLVVGDTVTGSVDVANRNDFLITVKIDDSKIDFEDNVVELEQDEQYSFEYEITITDTGSYNYIVQVLFETEEPEVSFKQLSFGVSLNFNDVKDYELEVTIDEPEADEEPEEEYVSKNKKTEELNEVCEHYSQCRNQRWLRGCIKQDCNWCCYNECTVMECDYEPRVASKEEIEKVQKDTNITVIGGDYINYQEFLDKENKQNYLDVSPPKNIPLTIYVSQDDKLSDAVNLNKILLVFVLMFLVMDLILIVFFWIKEHKKCDEDEL